jgi:hypothetical protein
VFGAGEIHGCRGPCRVSHPKGGLAGGLQSVFQVFAEGLSGFGHMTNEGSAHLQGFQVFAEDLSGFGQMTHEVLADLNDDYARAPILLFSVRGPPSPQEQVRDFSCFPLISYLAPETLSP